MQKYVIFNKYLRFNTEETRKNIAQELNITERQVEYLENRALYKFFLLLLEEYNYDIFYLTRDLRIDIRDYVYIFINLAKRYWGAKFDMKKFQPLYDLKIELEEKEKND